MATILTNRVPGLYDGPLRQKGATLSTFEKNPTSVTSRVTDDRNLTSTNFLKGYFRGLGQTLSNMPFEEINELVSEFLRVYREGGTIFTMGNGGHGSTAAHAINDINKHTVSNDERTKIVVGGERFRAMCLNDSVSTLTA